MIILHQLNGSLITKIRCADIIITGGQVTAVGGQYAEGIGSGSKGEEYAASCDNITISGGAINATGGEYGAGFAAAQKAAAQTSLSPAARSLPQAAKTAQASAAAEHMATARDAETSPSQRMSSM